MLIRAESGGKPAQKIRRLRARPARAAEGVSVNDVGQACPEGLGLFPRRDVARHRARKPTNPEVDLPAPDHDVQPGRQALSGFGESCRGQIVDAERFRVLGRRLLRNQAQE